MTHAVHSCRHGVVVAECRCLGPRAAVEVPCPPSCGQAVALALREGRPWYPGDPARAEAEAAVGELAALAARLEERSLELAALEAAHHREINPRHSVSSSYPHHCPCGWRGRRFPTSEVRRDPYVPHG